MENILAQCYGLHLFPATWYIHTVQVPKLVSVQVWNLCSNSLVLPVHVVLKITTNGAPAHFSPNARLDIKSIACTGTMAWFNRCAALVSPPINSFNSVLSQFMHRSADVEAPNPRFHRRVALSQSMEYLALAICLSRLNTLGQSWPNKLSNFSKMLYHRKPFVEEGHCRAKWVMSSVQKLFIQKSLGSSMNNFPPVDNSCPQTLRRNRID